MAGANHETRSWKVGWKLQATRGTGFELLGQVLEVEARKRKDSGREREGGLKP